MRLRDGTETQDPRLDRLVDFDERSRAYPVRALIAPEQAAAPRSYTWRCDRWLDQGNQGACVAFGWEHELAARPAVVTYGDAAAQEQVARERYWEMQRRDQWEGGSYPGASPFYEGTSVLAGAQLHVDLGTLGEYRWAFDLDDLVLAVGYKGPAVLGIPWYDGMFKPDDAGVLHPTGGVAGGHAILCNGVSVRLRLFRLHNSWGPGWGKTGDALIGFDDLERLLGEDGEACIPVVRHRAG